MTVFTEEYCKVFGKTKPVFPGQEHIKMMKTVFPNLSQDEILDLPWQDILPKTTRNILYQNLTNSLESISNEIGEDSSYYDQVYLKTKRVFSFLRPAKLNGVRLKTYLLDETNAKFLAGWTTDKSGYAQVPEYSLCDTLTGRMKIKSGPNFLLLPRELRNIITSRHGENGSIYYLDFVSLEPRTALCLNPTNPPIGHLPQDIYSHALKKLKLSTEISRQTIKQIILPQLYGQAKSIIISNLEKNKVRQPEEIVEMINDFFGIDDLKQKIVSEYEATGKAYIRTYFGRHVVPEESSQYAFLNYYIQSTSVDIALLGFLKILEKLEKIPGSLDLISPIFFLHDAMVIDVHKKLEHLIPKLLLLGSRDIQGLESQIFHMSESKL